MDAVEIVADASMASSCDGVRSIGSFTDQNIVQNDSSSQSAGTYHAPHSPQRSIQNSVPSSPSDRLNTSMDAAHSPMRTPAQADYLTGGRGTPYTPDTHSGEDYPTTRQRSVGGQGFISSDDEQTEPSSSAAGEQGYTRSDSDATSTFGRLIKSTKRRMNGGDRNKSNSDDGEENLLEGALIYGYLQKLGRNGKWQARWFETDGECLTYYKSTKRTKLLATLDLAKVGSIVIHHDDPNGCCFTINISERPYHLRADSRAACKDWVITLNRVKEARMQEGNVKLLMPDKNQPPDLLDHDFTPRVVVISNRTRTRAADNEEMNSWEASGWNENPAHDAVNYVAPPSSKRLARWQKPRTSFSRMASKVLRWARSIRKYGCQDADNHVILDHHVHPPGHDDKPKRPGNTSPIGRETGNTDASVGDRSGVPHNLDSDPVSPSIKEEDEEEETRELS